MTLTISEHRQASVVGCGQRHVRSSKAGVVNEKAWCTFVHLMVVIRKVPHMPRLHGSVRLQEKVVVTRMKEDSYEWMMGGICDLTGVGQRTYMIWHRVIISIR